MTIYKTKKRERERERERERRRRKKGRKNSQNGLALCSLTLFTWIQLPTHVNKRPWPQQLYRAHIIFAHKKMSSNLLRRLGDDVMVINKILSSAGPVPKGLTNHSVVRYWSGPVRGYVQKRRAFTHVYYVYINTHNYIYIYTKLPHEPSSESNVLLLLEWKNKMHHNTTL